MSLRHLARARAHEQWAALRTLTPAGTARLLAAARALPILPLLLCSGSVFAHGGGTMALATIVVRDHTVQYRLQIPQETILHSATLTSVREADYHSLAGAVAQSIHVRSEGSDCQPVPAAAGAPPDPRDDAVVLLHFACAEAPGSLTLTDDLYDVFGKDHRTIANVQYDNGSRQFVFQPDSRELRIEVPRPSRVMPPPAALGAALIPLIGFAVWLRHTRFIRS